MPQPATSDFDNSLRILARVIARAYLRDQTNNKSISNDVEIIEIDSVEYINDSFELDIDVLPMVLSLVTYK